MLDQARVIARDPFDASLSDLREAIFVLGRGYDRVEALALEQDRLRTLGGIPPVVDPRWANKRLAPPATASDPAAPALVRS